MISSLQNRRYQSAATAMAKIARGALALAFVAAAFNEYIPDTLIPDDSTPFVGALLGGIVGAVKFGS